MKTFIISLLIALMMYAPASATIEVMTLAPDDSASTVCFKINIDTMPMGYFGKFFAMPQSLLDALNDLLNSNKCTDPKIMHLMGARLMTYKTYREHADGQPWKEDGEQAKQLLETCIVENYGTSTGAACAQQQSNLISDTIDWESQ
jgi:hypothetical protein